MLPDRFTAKFRPVVTTITHAPQPGDTATCGTCAAAIHYDFPLAAGATALSPAVPSQWTHLHTLDPATLRTITYDHQAATR